jgi:hypothetical protein
LSFYGGPKLQQTVADRKQLAEKIAEQLSISMAFFSSSSFFFFYLFYSLSLFSLFLSGSNAKGKETAAMKIEADQTSSSKVFNIISCDLRSIKRERK